MTIDLDALEALEKKATPGEWAPVNLGSADEPMFSVKAVRIQGRAPSHEVALCATGDSPQQMETANAHFIAAASNALPELLRLARIGQRVERDAKEEGK